MTNTGTGSSSADRIIESFRDAGNTALESVRKFLDTVNGAFPDVGADHGPRQRIIDSAFKMTEQLVSASTELAKNAAKRAPAKKAAKGAPAKKSGKGAKNAAKRAPAKKAAKGAPAKKSGRGRRRLRRGLRRRSLERGPRRLRSAPGKGSQSSKATTSSALIHPVLAAPGKGCPSRAEVSH